jgi:murein DD-endopeptidase MepM/ murein hydrolase activator NlpD
MRGRPRCTVCALGVCLPLLIAACEGGGGPVIRFLATTPHQEYEAKLRQAGLDSTALGREWIAAADRALSAPIDVDVPHLEVRYLDPTRAMAVAYRVHLERGQRLVAHLSVADARPRDARLFVDVFYVADSTAPPTFAAAADSSGWDLEYVALRPGTYVLRVQPELLRGGRVTFDLAAHASLGFPVVGRDMAAIRSGFGAERDAGAREHQGVDIFAPRGTPVVAAVAGRVSRVNWNRLGGRVVWLRETRYDRRLYYAHLDSQAVRTGMVVNPGDTLGFVGNTGNARTTPPHLHFGIYMRGVGAVDPYFHLLDPEARPPAFAGDSALVGHWARIARSGAVARTAPDRSAPVLAPLDRLTPMEVLAGVGSWYRTRLPDGREGYVAVRDAEPLDPIASATVTVRSVLRVAPSADGVAIDSIAEGATLPLLGRYGAYALVGRADGSRGWIDAARLAFVAPAAGRVSAPNRSAGR